MNWRAFIILAILLLIFIPIPIKITVNYIGNNLSIYIYKFKIKPSKDNKQKFKKNVKSKSEKYKITLTDIKPLIGQIDCLKFKPTVKIRFCLDYGLIDACSTGIAFGVIHSFSPFIFRLLSIMFKIKKYELQLNPDFDKLTLSANMKSIIFISLAKIIYIIVMMIKYFLLIKQKKSCAYSNI